MGGQGEKSPDGSRRVFAEQEQGGLPPGGWVGRAVLGTNPRLYAVEIAAGRIKTPTIFQRVYSPILAYALGF